MTELLREELRRLSDDAPTPPRAGELWAAGRRARHRSRALAAGLVLAVLGLVTSALPGLPVARLAAEVAGGESVRAVGVPDRIAAVPDRVLDTMTPTSRPGRAAAAYLTSGGRAVVVSAADGSYHRLRLPSQPDSQATFKQLALNGTWLALSPDGDSVAYSWERPPAEGGVAGRPVPTGLAVLDLTTGRERSIPLSGGSGVVVTDLTWSPDARWLAFHGLRTKTWVGSRISYGPAVYGRVDADSLSVAQAVAPQAMVQGPAVGDDGIVRLVAGSGEVATPEWASVDPQLESDGDGYGQQYAVSPSGRLTLAGTTLPTRSVRLAGAALASGLSIAIPEEDYPEGATVRPLGWIDDNHAVAELVRVADYDGSSFIWDGRTVVLVDVRAARLTIVGEVDTALPDAGGIETLTVATGLMTLDRPTVHRPEPRWPWPTERYLTVGGLLLVVLVVLTALLLGRRRRPTGRA